MEIDILTTLSPHHIYFCNSLAKEYKVNIVLEEPRSPSYYDTSDRLDDLLLETDIKTLLNNNKLEGFTSYNSIIEVENINNLKDINSELSIVYGTGIIKKDLISQYKVMLNLHGGDPSKYRGLDTNLWAFFHSDFNNMGVALHHVSPELDTGDLIQFMNIDPASKLAEIRAKSAVVSYNLVKNYLDGVYDNRRISYTPGRYYRAMPSAIKKFLRENHIESN
mgnify:CR=1 FL=1